MRRHTQHISLPANAHILVVKMAGIGDMLLATPALRALRETYPQARIDLLVTPDSAGLLNGWSVIDRIIVVDKYLFDYPQQMLKNPRNLLRLTPLWHDLHNGHYDAVLLLHHLTLPFGRLKHQLLMRATGAKWRVGLDNGHGWFLNVRVKDNGFGAMHEAEYNLAVAEAIGATTSDKRLIVPLSEQERRQAQQLVYEDESPETIKRPIIAMHPGSGGYSTARRWAPERFAVAVGTPTVAIFGLTNHKAWGPYTGGALEQYTIVVRLDLPCMPCFYRGHDLGTPEGCATRDCLALLGVDPVAAAARRLLRQAKSKIRERQK